MYLVNKVGDGFTFSQDELAKALMCLTIDNVITKRGNDVGRFEYMLYSCHNGYFHDCLNNPEFLLLVESVYEDGHLILQDIIAELEKFSHIASISRCLSVLRQYRHAYN